MGLFRLIKDLRSFRKLRRALDEDLQRRKLYNEMSREELAALSDNELYAAAITRTEFIVELESEPSVGFERLSDPEKVFFALDYLDVEVNNGGLCQFFVNSSRFLAPYISEYLGVIGAEEHKKLFDGFISKYGIDLTALSSFQVDRVEDYEQQTLRYPFDEYDDAFYCLDSLREPLTAYIRANIDAFFRESGES